MKSLYCHNSYCRFKRWEIFTFEMRDIDSRAALNVLPKSGEIILPPVQSRRQPVNQTQITARE